MTARRIFFWLHLGAGGTSGLVILLMCVTGAVLGFERQIVRWAERHERRVAPRGAAQRLAMEPLLKTTLREHPTVPTTVTWHPSADSAVELGFGRDRVAFVDPYTGVVHGHGAVKLRAFFSQVEGMHRWLGADGAARPRALAITGAANLMLLFLAGSGLYLWYPRNCTWSRVKTVMTFRRGLSGRARDFNWHNTIGFWMCVPLAVMVTCSTVMSYQWANNLVYGLSGTPVPAPNTRQRPTERDEAERQAPRLEGLNTLCTAAEMKVARWQTITMRMPGGKASNVIFQIDAGDGGRPDKRSQLTLDRATGQEVRWEPFSKNSRGRRIRAWMRFAHTGEAGGLAGQSLASATSLGGVFLAYTGMAMAIRRFLAGQSKSKP